MPVDGLSVLRQVHHFAGVHRLLIDHVHLQDPGPGEEIWPHVLVKLRAPWWSPHWLTERMDRRYQRDLERVLPSLRVQVISV
jgi:hypothetical protein